MEKFIADENIHDGHRGRMRAKLLAHGRGIFDTYELLEMLLYYSVPYKDTNPISKRLLYAFDGLDGVMRADVSRLTELSGIGERTANLISSVGRLTDIIGAEIVSDEIPELSSFEQVGEYLVDYFHGVTKKCVVAAFFDSSMRLLKLMKLYDLEFESGGVRAKAFLDEAVACNAAVIISAHNHPYSSCYPTPGDRETNYMITDALAAAGFVHAEHYIISGNKYAGIGAMNRFSNVKLGQMPMVSQFVASCDCEDDDVILGSSSREPKDLILPNEAYNKVDAEYFAELLSYASAKHGRDLAVQLLKRYRTIENVITASDSELCKLVGERMTCFIKLLAHITSRRKTDLFRFGRKYNSAQIADYLKAVFLGESVEKIYMITFDSEDRVTGCHLLGEGTVSSSDVLPRKAVERGVSSMAKSVAIAHNHPFGTVHPSSDDINVTSHFEGIFASCEIRLVAHYIVAGQLCDTINFDY